MFASIVHHLRYELVRSNATYPLAAPGRHSATSALTLLALSGFSVAHVTLLLAQSLITSRAAMYRLVVDVRMLRFSFAEITVSLVFMRISSLNFIRAACRREFSVPILR